MKKVILFDIDLTLINRKLLGELQQKSVTKTTKIEAKEILEIENKYRSKLESSKDFNPNDFFEETAKAFGKEKEKIEKSFYNQKIYKESLFPETKKVLEMLRKKFVLGIFSEGFIDYQTIKLKNSGIYDFFDPEYIFIERRKMEDKIIDKLPKNAIIVDDKEEVVEKLFSTKKFNPIWINRVDERKSEKFKTIKNLEDLLS